MNPTLAVVHNNIDDASSIGAIAAWAVRSGLERGWDVTTVCRDLDPDLAGDVRQRALYVPPRLHLVQWSVARATVRRALGGWRPDALLVYQAQIAALADVWHVEYLSRPAREAGTPRAPGWRGAVSDAQAAGVAALEDRYIRSLGERPMVLFCSEGLQRDFIARYGSRTRSGVLHNPALHTVAATADAGLRARLVGDHSGPVLGFLGGTDPRKGLDLLLPAVAADPSLFLVLAGPGRRSDPTPDRCRDLGLVSDVSQVLDAVDVLVVPSRYEPFGIVVAEAASRGVPVLVAPTLGAAPLIESTGAGLTWEPPAPLGPVVGELIAERARFAAGAVRLAAALDPKVLADQLFVHLDAAAAR